MKSKLTRYNAVCRIEDVCDALEPIAANAQCPEQERIIDIAIHCLRRLDKDFEVLNNAFKVTANASAAWQALALKAENNKE